MQAFKECSTCWGKNYFLSIFPFHCNAALQWKILLVGYLKNSGLRRPTFKEMAMAAALLCCPCISPSPPDPPFPNRRNPLGLFHIAGAVKCHPVTLKFPLDCRYFLVRNIIPSKKHNLGPIEQLRIHSVPQGLLCCLNQESSSNHAVT